MSLQGTISTIINLVNSGVDVASDPALLNTTNQAAQAAANLSGWYATVNPAAGPAAAFAAETAAISGMVVLAVDLSNPQATNLKIAADAAAIVGDAALLAGAIASFTEQPVLAAVADTAGTILTVVGTAAARTSSGVSAFSGASETVAAISAADSALSGSPDSVAQSIAPAVNSARGATSAVQSAVVDASSGQSSGLYSSIQAGMNDVASAFIEAGSVADPGLASAANAVAQAASSVASYIGGAANNIETAIGSSAAAVGNVLAQAGGALSQGGIDPTTGLPINPLGDPGAPPLGSGAPGNAGGDMGNGNAATSPLVLDLTGQGLYRRRLLRRELSGRHRRCPRQPALAFGNRPRRGLEQRIRQHRSPAAAPGRLCLPEFQYNATLDFVLPAQTLPASIASLFGRLGALSAQNAGQWEIALRVADAFRVDAHLAAPSFLATIAASASDSIASMAVQSSIGLPSM